MDDRAWIRTALERYQGALIASARRITGDPERARDAVQETFLRLCAQERAQVEPGLAAWLFTVCRNVARDMQRSERAMHRKSEIASRENAVARDYAHDPASATEAAEEGARALYELSKLPPKQEEVLRLRFQAGLSYREISAVTGHSIGNVGFLIHVAMRTLQDKLGASAPKAGGA